MTSTLNSFHIHIDTGVNGKGQQQLVLYLAHLCIDHFNPLTLRVPRKVIFCYFHTFENNLEIKQVLTKYLKESCCLSSDQHFSFKYFPKNVFVRKIL